VSTPGWIELKEDGKYGTYTKKALSDYLIAKKSAPSTTSYTVKTATGNVVMDATQLQDAISKGEIKADTKVWKEGMPNWITAGTAEDLKSMLFNFPKLRKELNNNIKHICNINNLPKHTGDYALKHCITMYKSAISNHNGNLNKFNIRNMMKDRRRKNLVIEPANISKKINSFCKNILGEINSNIQLNIIKQNSVLQYDCFNNKYIIITPEIVNNEKKVYQYEKCGIDIGIRTFLTTYSEQEVFEIGTSDITYKMIDNYNKRFTRISKSYKNGYINKKKYNYLNMKYRQRLRDKIDDMHRKVANMLLKRYQTIVIGNVST
jgi:hypothetical protein